MTKARWALVFVAVLISSLATGSIVYGLYRWAVRDESQEARHARIAQSGHYSSRDGQVRFVLDQTQTGPPKVAVPSATHYPYAAVLSPAKLAFDGSPDVVELQRESVFGHGGGLQRLRLTTPNHVVLSVSPSDGSITLVEPSHGDRGRGERVTLQRDGDGRMLGPPTIVFPSPDAGP
jgi:hypothetical protein